MRLSNKKLNVAIFTSAARGLAHYVAELFPILKNDVNPYYVTFDGQQVDDIVREEVGRVYQIVRDQSASSLLEVIQFLKNKKIDVINLHVSDTVRRMHMQYVAMMGIAKSLGIPICMTIHDVFTIEAMDIEPAAIELLYGLGDSYIVGNDNEKDKLAFYFNVPEESIVVATHGPYTIFDKNKISPAEAKDALGLTGKKVVLFFGQTRPNKGLKYLIKAFPIILKNHPDAFLYISTDLHLSTPELNEYLVRLNRSKVIEQIKLVTDYIPSKDIEKVFKAADVVVLPYTQISQSGILNLAYGFKKPVVVSSAFMEADHINGLYGYSFKSEDHTELANVVSKILSMPDMGKKMGKTAYIDTVVKGKSWKKAAESSIRAYKIALKKKHSH